MFWKEIKRFTAAVLSIAMLTAVIGMKPTIVSRAASYVNTNLNTFIHDSADEQIGHPGEDMQIHVRVGYNGVNGLYNPPTEEIRNIRVRLSNDQSYLADNKGPGTFNKSNPYNAGGSEEEEAQADAWEEGYQKGKQNAYKNDSHFYYSLINGVYPFEVNASLFTQEQQKESLKLGEYLDLTFNVTVRSDALKMKDNEGNVSDGYFGIPFTIWYEIPENGSGHSGKFSKTEFINVFITENGEIANPATQTRDQAFVIGENQETPSGNYPDVMSYGVNFRNQSGKPLYDVTVKLDTNLAEKSAVQLTASAKGEASKDFPFNINEANYDRKFEKVEAGEVLNVPYSMAVKQNAATGFYPLHYIVSYKRAPGAGTSATEDYTFYVNIRNASMIDQERNKGEFNENDRTKARLIVDSYSTVPEKVYAGEPFQLILNMKNASSSINASNILFSLSSAKDKDSPVFNMEGGANSIVVNSLPAGQTTTLKLNMTAMAGVDPKAYSITIEEKYDSPEFKNATEKVDIDIQVNQVARLSVSNFEISPQEGVEVGNDANVMFGINNTGKVILYNVEAILEAPSIKKGTMYLGNIEPGKTGNVDMMVTGIAPTEDDGTIPITIRYEDVNGNSFEEKSELTLMVTEAMDFSDLEQDMPMEPENPGMSLPVKIGLGAGIAAALGAAIALILRAKRRKQKENEQDDEII